MCDIAKRFIAQGDEVAFFSARNESQREGDPPRNKSRTGLVMVIKVIFKTRRDYRSDVEFKRELADKFLDMGGKIDLIFDDRQCVVDMWRDEGFVVVQVADGDF